MRVALHRTVRIRIAILQVLALGQGYVRLRFEFRVGRIFQATRPRPKETPLSNSPLGASDRIRAICDEFRRVWSGHAPAQISEFLKRVDLAARTALLIELIRIDVEIRQRIGEQPDAADYVDHFPLYAKYIANAFQIQRHVGSSAGKPTPTVTYLSPFADPESRAKRVPADTSANGQRTQFGSFELIKKLGEGGMGMVYQAKQLNAGGRLVALKVIRPDRLGTVADDARREAIARFRVEAQAAARLTHENLVTVHEVGEIDGQPFYSMRYVEGRSLRSLVTNGPLDNRRAAEILLGVARGVHEAHRHGILHRDLKPENVIVEASTGTPLVADFGLAKFTEDREAALTRYGVGTPQYMPPEQIDNAANATTASDVYSLGATLYHLMTGRPLFDGDLYEVLRKVREDQPTPVRQLNANADADLETLCLKCLEKDPAKRVESAEALVEELERYLSGRPIRSRPVSQFEHAWRWCRRNPAFAGFGSLLVVVLLSLAIGGPLVAAYQSQLKNNELTAKRQAEDLAKEMKGLADEKTALAQMESKARAIAETQLYYSQINRAAGDVKAGRHAEAQSVLAAIPFDQRHWEANWLSRQAEGTPLTIRGQTGQAVSVAFSPDGRRLVGGGLMETAKVWDAVTGESTLTICKGYPMRVNSVAFSPDSRHFATGTTDFESLNQVKLWDAATGENIMTISVPIGEDAVVKSVTCVAYSPDGRSVLSADFEGMVRLWDTTTGENTKTFKNIGDVQSAAFSPDGRYILCGSWGSIDVWDVSTGNKVHTIYGHFERVKDVAYSPNGRQFATGSADRTIKLWDAATGKPIRTLEGHSSDVQSVAFSPDGRRLASGSSDMTVRVWNLATGQNTNTFHGHTGTVWSLQFSPDGRRIASCDGDAVKVWDATPIGNPRTFDSRFERRCRVAFSPDGHCVAIGGWGKNTQIDDRVATDIHIVEKVTGESLLVLHGHERYFVGGVAFSPDGKLLASGGDDMTVRLWNTTTGKNIHVLKGHTDEVDCVVFSRDGRHVLSGSADQSIRIWDAATGKNTRTLTGHTDRVSGLAFSPNGQSAVSCSWDGTIELWDVSSGQTTRTLKGHSDRVLCVAFSHDGQQVVSGGRNGTIRLWDPATGENTLTFAGHNDFLTSIDFSPDDQRILTGSQDRTLKLWDTGTGENVLTLAGHDNYVSSVAFSPDGQQILSASDDETIKSWDSAVGESVRTHRGHTQPISDIALSPDDRRFVSASPDQTIRMWDVESGENILTLLGHEKFITSISFSPDGLQIVSGSGDQTTKLWDATTGKCTRTFKGHASPIISVAFSRDGNQIVSRGLDGLEIIWDITSGEQIHDESVPVVLDNRTVSEDGLIQICTARTEVLLIRKNSQFNAWIEDSKRRQSTATAYHTHAANEAETDTDWFAAEFHLRQLLEAENIPNREDLAQRHQRAKDQLHVLRPK